MWNQIPSSGPPRSGAWLPGLTLGVLVAALALVPLARAGPYEAIQCAAHLGAGPGGFHFSRSSPDFHRVKACASGDGMGVTHARSRTSAGGYGTWVAEPPAGTYFTGGSLIARGRRHGAYHPRLLVAPPGGRAGRHRLAKKALRQVRMASRQQGGPPDRPAFLHSPGRSLRPYRQAEDLRQAGAVPPGRCLAAGRQRGGRRAGCRARAARRSGAHRAGSRRRLGGPPGPAANEPQALRLGLARLQCRRRSARPRAQPLPQLGAGRRLGQHASARLP